MRTLVIAAVVAVAAAFLLLVLPLDGGQGAVVVGVVIGVGWSLFVDLPRRALDKVRRHRSRN